jgi:hypothetical protein
MAGKSPFQKARKRVKASTDFKLMNEEIYE